MPTRIPRPCKTERPCKIDISDSTVLSKISKAKSPTNSIISRTFDTGKSNSSFSTHKSSISARNKLHRCVSAKVKMVDVACDTSDVCKNDELTLFKHNIECLQQKCKTQDSELEKLRRENNILKIELQNYYNARKCLSIDCPLLNVTSNIDTALVPKPFESCLEEPHEKNFSNTDSEMIITMKNCRNEVTFDSWLKQLSTCRNELYYYV
jgi:hypothetical protein